MVLALIAGQGGLPPHLAETLLARGAVPVVCELEQFPSEVTGDLPRLTFRLETLGSFLADLQNLGVTQICMAGAMRRVPIDPALIDAATAPLVPLLQQALAKGDDGTLRAIIALFESRGFTVVGAAEIAPDLLPDPGCLTGTPPVDLPTNIAAAEAALIEMGKADLGQALVLRDGRVLAQEDDRGTDAMLRDLAPDQRSLPAKGAVLFKAPKPGQDLRADMPVIGLTTAENAAAAGLSGIVIKAGGVMMLNPGGITSVLQSQGMFLMVTP